MRLARLRLPFLLTLAVAWLAPGRAVAQSVAPAATFAVSEGAGTTTVDSSGNGNDGTLMYGAAWTTAGRFGDGLQFNGRAARVQLAAGDPLAFTAGVTVEMWVYPTADDHWQQLWWMWAPNGGYYLDLVPGGMLKFDAHLSAGEQAAWTPAASLPLNTWTHVAATYDGATMRVYVNGVDAGRTSATGALPAMGAVVVSGDGFSGILDEVRIYDHALTSGQVRLDLATPVDPATAFQVSVTTPADGTFGILTTPISATFSRSVDPSSVTNSTMVLRDSSNTPVPATVIYDPSTRTATLTPAHTLPSSSDYTVDVAGGYGGVTDAGGNPLAGDVLWTFRTAAPDTEPSAAYSFSEGAGTTTADRSGNGNTGVLAYGPAWTGAGRFGGGLLFNGNLARVQVPVSDTLALTTALTVEMWVYPTLEDDWQQLWGKWTPNRGYSLWLVPGGQLKFDAHFGNRAQAAWTSVGSVPINTWTHIAVTYDGSTMQVVVNGVPSGSAPATGTLETSTNPLAISGDGFLGAIEEVRIYRRALSTADVILDMLTPVDQATPFQVSGATPSDGEVGISTTPITAMFSRSADPATLTSSTIQLRDGSNATVAATIAYDEAARTVTLIPAAPLAALTNYTVHVAGGSAGVKDTSGNALAGGGVWWTFQTAAAPTGPVALYAFSEGAGTTTADASGNGNDAVLVYGPSWTTAGRFGDGLQFYGGLGGVQLPTTDTLTFTTGITVEMWVYATSANDWQRLWAQWAPGGGYALNLVPGGFLKFNVYFPGGDQQAWTVPGAVPLNRWVHVATTYDGAAMRIYLNGIEMATTAAAGTLPVSATPMFISGDGFRGVIDEVRLFDYARSRSQVQLDFATPVDTATPFHVGVTTPADGALGILTTPITATFSRPADASTVTTATMQLRDAGNAEVPATVSYDAATQTATLTPTLPLPPLTDYTVRVVGGNSGVTDASAVAMAGDVQWTFRTAAPDTTPSASYAMSEGAGTTTADGSGNGNNGLLVDGPAWTTGRVGTGLLFGGNAGRVQLPLSDTLTLTAAMSIDAWIYPLSESTYGEVWRQGPWGGGYSLELAPDGRLVFWAHLSSGDRLLASAPGSAPTNTWTYVAATFGGGVIQLYVNGVLSATTAAAGTLPVLLDPLVLSGDSFVGILDEVRVYRRALSPVEILQDQDASLDDKTPPTILSTMPPGGATNVEPASAVSATFSEAMLVSSISSATFELRDSTGALVPASVAYDANAHVAVLVPATALANAATYTARVKGGTADPRVKDLAMNALQADVSWTFTTAAAQVLVNGVGVPGPLAVLYGNTLSVQVSHGPANATDVVRLVQSGSASSSSLASKYLNGSTTAPSQGLSSATLAFSLPGPGSYEFRFFAQNGQQLLATSPTVVVVSGPQVAAGAAHTILLTDTGAVWAWGANGNGQLGLGDTTGRFVPTQVPGLSGIAAIATGGNSTLVLESDGTVWGWGANNFGQLGDGTTTGRAAPVSAIGLTNVVAISAGQSHAMALRSDGTVWTWGYNGYGALGDGTTTNRSTPVQVTSLGSSVTAVNASGNSSRVLKADGTVWSWGDNQVGQAGDGTTTTPRKTPVKTSGVTNVTAVNGGDEASYGLAADGTAKSWGYGGDGELGDGTTTMVRTTPAAVSVLSSIAAVRGGSSHALAVNTVGAVWAWGFNLNGQVGDGTTIQRNAPVPIAGPDSVVSVAGGGSHSVAVSSDGRVWAWGLNSAGQLGDGTVNQRTAPAQISEAGFAWHVATPQLSPFGGTFTNPVNVSVTEPTTGAVIHYTTNGVDPTAADPTVPSGGAIAVAQSVTFKARAWLNGSASNVAAAVFTLAVPAPSFSPGAGTYTATQSVTMSDATSGVTIRYTTDGSTPTSSSPVYTGPVTVATGLTLKAAGFRAGWAASAVTFADYHFNYGTLAAPTFTPAPSLVAYGTPITLTAASAATIRYTTDGTVPTSASPMYAGPITMAGTATILAKAFDPDWTTSAQSGGAYTVKVSAPVLSPGGGTYAPGQLVTIADITPGAAIHYTTNGADPTAIDPAIASGGTVVAGNYTLKAQAFETGWTSSDVAGATYALNGPFTSYAVSAGNSHTVALENDGTVWTWGSNTNGVLGDASPGRSTAAMVNGLTGIVAVAAGSTHNVALGSDGSVWTWGANASGQLGDNTSSSRSAFAVVPGLSSVTAVAAGSNFSAALKSDGTVWAWGANSAGQLGDGTTTARLAPVQVVGVSNVVALAAGDSHMLARESDGTLWAWGSNAYGQLGDGTTTAETAAVQVPGIVATEGPWAGSSHSLAAAADGSVYAWGSNGNGEVGDGTQAQRLSPTLVSALSNVLAADGSSFSVAAGADAGVWTWGNNGFGQLGDGTTANRSTPSRVALVSASAVAAGLNHTVVVGADGTVWAWGLNASGQLGDGTADDRHTPVQISGSGFAWKTSTPRMSPSGGLLTTSVSVTLTAVTPGAEIHYTISGADPTMSDPAVASGGTVVVSQPETLKARAWAPNMPASNVASAVFTKDLPPPAVAPPGGTYFATQTVVLSSSVPGATILFTNDGSDPTAASTVYSGALTVDATTTVKAKAVMPGWTDSGISTSAYTLKATAPTFTPGGGSYTSAQTVAMATTTPSATMRYTTDGTEPTSASPVYAAPITVSTSGTDVTPENVGS